MLSLFFVLILLSLSHSRSIVPVELDENYAIIFDAGSKGTRLYLFKYTMGEFNKAPDSLNIANLDYEFEQLLYCELNGN